MTKYFFLALTLLVFSVTAIAQTKAEKDQARFERQIEEQKAEYIANIVNGFDLDEFQKHILTQQLHSYYDEVSKINMLEIPSFEKTTLINDLNNTHFKDFENMLGKEFVTKLIEKAKGEDKTDQKKKKKKKKKKKDTD
jgi:hypothetical protein